MRLDPGAYLRCLVHVQVVENDEHSSVGVPYQSAQEADQDLADSGPSTTMKRTLP